MTRAEYRRRRDHRKAVTRVLAGIMADARARRFLPEFRVARTGTLYVVIRTYRLNCHGIPLVEIRVATHGGRQRRYGGKVYDLRFGDGAVDALTAIRTEIGTLPLDRWADEVGREVSARKALTTGDVEAAMVAVLDRIRDAATAVAGEGGMDVLSV